MPKGLEIEKKYLIKYPDVSLLKERGAVKKQIKQVYLSAAEGVSERVRRTETEEGITYTHTIKTKIKGIVRREDEYLIDREEYDALLLRADSSCHPIVKDRYVLEENGLAYEFDLFPFWQDQAFLEIELEAEDQVFPLPDFVTVLADVSEDKRFTNHALAKMKQSKS